MRKIAFLFLLFISFSKLLAQDIDYGLKLGVNLSQISAEGQSLDNRFGVHFGGFIEFKISEKFSLQPELLYSMQGGSESETFMGSTFKSTIKADYLNLPVLAKVYFTNQLFLEAGPQIGFLLSAKYEESFDGDSESIDIKNEFNTIDFSLALGFGYKFNNKLSTNLRYNVGLSNIAKDSDVSIRNGVFQISLGYKF